MVIIRLARRGAKKRPFYDVVVADSRKARDGRFIEKLGFFNPIAKGEEVRLKLNIERIEEWVGTGAQLSNKVKSLIKDHKNPDRLIKKPKKAKKKEIPAETKPEAETKKPEEKIAEPKAKEKKAEPKAEEPKLEKKAPEPKSEEPKPEEKKPEPKAEEPKPEEKQVEPETKEEVKPEVKAENQEDKAES
jgi:small subunit ribosomal protein S16